MYKIIVIIAIITAMVIPAAGTTPASAQNLWCGKASYPLLKSWTYRKRSNALPKGWVWGQRTGYRYSQVWNDCK